MKKGRPSIWILLVDINVRMGKEDGDSGSLGFPSQATTRAVPLKSTFFPSQLHIHRTRWGVTKGERKKQKEE